MQQQRRFPIGVLLLLAMVSCGHTLAVGTPECPEKVGTQAYAHTENCDQFFLCTNGTLTLETCENGLLFDGKGAVHNHCNYNWAVDCKGRQWDPTPISTPGCEYQFGLYAVSKDCSTTYIKCAHGEPHEQDCDAGLAYDERIHGCNWPDQLLEHCNPEAVVGFKCPTKVDPNSVAARFWPFPRFPVSGDCHRLITCVEGYPRLISCGEDKVFDENTLTCEEPEYASGGCANYGK
ncbi:protein obstructor-E [Scaptodrosophila lebanonensis]|uniref:Protein obstructor-E n=1 Tax=Drosophila lebanonensis TaxID=7225 RepID=A0A6J2TUB9_DROLE|nr:protein obstructor-E [Scaptodrosophila lebanonensis]